ncbi:NUDIX domain-containing protein [Quadrisphaera granulorum]|uniref:NUDIX domain-containing protein n=1 Tax=Quadrisphaera granulorum TaxID=317664 RepID=A0A315ZPI3_9ACTN|nr:NUDIX domain-containing protein [Quadrisphaera granulorum]PWJ47202.1 NUDIX domain-containing protein [Quadrisphaera granulorum]SZE98888.1 NUDIX domain-containing protein [Quadrisphaera granulorum]
MDTRIAAYAVVVAEHEGRPSMLLAHWNELGRSGWTLPGGGIDPGEDPADAAVREVREETGYEAELEGLLGIDSVVVSPERRLQTGRGPLHALRIVYRARVVGGELRDEVGGTTDTAAWVPLDTVDTLDRVELLDIGRRFAGLL